MQLMPHVIEAAGILARVQRFAPDLRTEDVEDLQRELEDPASA
jgi:hypothetical protein